MPSLRAERDEFRQKREACRLEREEIVRQKEFNFLKEREYNVQDPLLSVKDELMKELAPSGHRSDQNARNRLRINCRISYRACHI